MDSRGMDRGSGEVVMHVGRESVMDVDLGVNEFVVYFENV
jgi:hypothetical protein